MTDNEIIKALECCGVEEANCRKCIFNLQSNCRIVLAKEAFEIINRLQAENKKLKNQFDELSNVANKLHEENYRQKAEVERLEKDRKENFEMWKKLCEQAEEKHEKMFQEAKATIRPKAIKEFAERLKEYREIVSYDRDFDAYVYGSHIHIDIDEFENLVKEIAGEQ